MSAERLQKAADLQDARKRREKHPYLPPGFIIAVVFISAKIFGFVNLSWWWILAPIWAPSALAIAMLLAFVLLGCALWLWGER